MGPVWVGFSVKSDPEPLGSKNLNPLSAPEPIMWTQNQSKRVSSRFKPVNPYSLTSLVGLWRPIGLFVLSFGRLKFKYHQTSLLYDEP